MMLRSVPPQSTPIRSSHSKGRSSGPSFRLGLLLGALLVAGCPANDPPTEKESDSAPVSVIPQRTGPPNLILVTLDTTRADALGSYGQSRPTSPAVDAARARAATPPFRFVCPEGQGFDFHNVLELPRFGKSRQCRQMSRPQ
ncbi:hypothetical protein MK280_17490, partial [Myxococcota bacterium]|nr:hypothetical protein [Myxococcota bacterium]